MGNTPCSSSMRSLYADEERLRGKVWPGAEVWRAEAGWRLPPPMEEVSDPSDCLDEILVRPSCWDSIDMDDWRGGLAKDGKGGESSPGGSFVACEDGLAPGWRLRSGDPTGPKAEGELP